jgi:hypothetical protein
VCPLAAELGEKNTVLTTLLNNYLLSPIRPPQWSSGQSFWLQVQRSGLDSRRYHIFWVVVGLERGPLNLMSTSEELPEGKNSGSGLESREYGRRDPSCLPRGTLYPQKSVLISPTNGVRSAGKVRSRIQAKEFIFVIIRNVWACPIHSHTNIFW